ncbi:MULTISPECIES: M20 metallopeptidase family protein [Psychrilyobacter]|uniref:Amidohydrolase n=1 Tax=Psychrilyobacter piezotolerans TaxID=2293438 RepID=A0ABX9KGQ3_9FUSO|nr:MULTISPECIES: amidohydrolase [Psychrilyobacter]MCS5422232.1 amidohydrolase [Psychrilyobacter sp. S5]NDI78267.1 N-acetyldiaminopimelate deacetylase [Psychrilyobacter piezotolerans]RDE61175.1 amidohydrolase [Psychrilyobacter sp. S5]REI40843.1 amidohydrolase [Psychrilyobacter piezotolerans]
MEKITENMKKYRRNLHEIPELGYMEKKTQTYLLQEIKKMGYEPEIICGTGIYVYLDGNSKETYGFRTDMDALTILEETGVSYESKHTGLMHACGHDGHMATLLGFMDYLRGKKLKKNILIIFQPAEEGPGGAKDIVTSGILEKYNVVGIFGLHLFPKLEEGIIGCRAGGFMAKAAEINIVIRGKSGHGGQPHLGVDSIQAAGKMLEGFNLITSKFIAPFDPSIIAIGKIEGGTIRNIIPEVTRMEGTIRAFSTETFNFIVNKIRDIARGMELSYGVEIEIDLAEGYPPVINDREYYDVLEDVVRGEEKLKFQEIDPEMLAEDFGFYQEVSRGLFFFVGTKNEDLGYVESLHNSKFNFDEKVLENGLRVYRGICKKLGILD